MGEPAQQYILHACSHPFHYLGEEVGAYKLTALLPYDTAGS